MAQNDSIPLKYDKEVEKKSFVANPYDANAPAKAAFFSAILPGLGQAYNKSYWKIPLVYAGLGTTLFFYFDNNSKYNDYRDAYKRRLAGYEDDQFFGFLTDENLIQGQKQFREFRDISLLLSIGMYILNIIDANVEAHLNQFSITEDLTLRPSHIQNFSNGQNSFGVSLSLKIN
jgi:hypothetical protein